MDKRIMSGDEAVARGAWEGGCSVAAAYPGTPSTEILENIALYKSDIYCEWSCSEKTAMELVAGASIGGARSLAAMKHVGMNVATDPIFSMGYAGVTGGLVIACADDPGCHSSQNEQDNRLYAPHAKLAMLEPSDSQECKDFARDAFALSEKFDIPVLLRMTTRVCHSKSLVEVGERTGGEIKPYVRKAEKYSLLPANARRLHVSREESLKALEEYSNNCPYNFVEDNGAATGIVTSGISYQYAKEIFGDTVNYLKLGFTHPLPRKLMADFCKSVSKIIVIEENEPYLENMVRQLGFDCTGKDKVPICGELDTGILRRALTDEPAPACYTPDVEAPARPPVLCAGCPHRGFFLSLGKKMKNFVPVGDIGCYALGVNPPLNGFDMSLCMGAGFSATIGLSKALEKAGDSRKALGMLGDSTFFHSGLTSLINIIASNANVVACLLDNSITAMTGHQDHPGTAKNLMGEASPVVSNVALIRAAGIDDEHLRIVDPLDLEAVGKALDDAYAATGPFVIVTKRPCALIKEVQRANAGRHCVVDADKCKSCKACMKVTCPAIAFRDGKAVIADEASCTACGLCMQVCKFGAISKVGD